MASATTTATAHGFGDGHRHGCGPAHRQPRPPPPPPPPPPASAPATAPDPTQATPRAHAPGPATRALFRSNVHARAASAATGSRGAPGGLDKLLQVQGFFMTPTAKAAATQVALASDPALGRAAAGGKYFVDGKPAEPAKAATDPSTAAKLWELSERQAGVTFDPAA